MGSLYLARLTSAKRTELVQELHSIQSGLCFICEDEIDLAVHGDDLDIDHVIPTNMNGKDDPLNFALTHSSCNRSKQAANLEVARILHRFSRLAEATQKDNRNPNLDDILKQSCKAQYQATFSIVGNSIKFSLSQIGRNEVVKIPLYKDSLSGFQYFFAVFPIEYLYHDKRINPRSIGKNISKLVTEFYERRPQLHISLGWIECKDGEAAPVEIFDGQHKAAAQILLGTKEIPVRVFVNPNLDILLATNTNAGTTLRQVGFDKSVERHLGSALYIERVKRYKQDRGLSEGDFSFSEKDLVKHFRGQSSQMKRYILDSVRDTVTHHPDNKLREYIEFSGKGKERPLSYSTLDKSFYPLFIFPDVLDTTVSYNMDAGTNPRELEKENLLALMNMIAEELYIGKFDSEITADRIERRIQDGEDLPHGHIRCCRLSREEIMVNWLKLVKGVVQHHFATNGMITNQEKLFQHAVNTQLWKNIRNFIRNLADLPVWVNKELSETVFGGKPNRNYWESIFATGKSPQGVSVLTEPLNLLKMIVREEA